MKRDLPHEMVNHELEYARKDIPEIHTQNIGNYWLIFKRGVWVDPVDCKSQISIVTLQYVPQTQKEQRPYAHRTPSNTTA